MSSTATATESPNNSAVCDVFRNCSNLLLLSLKLLLMLSLDAFSVEYMIGIWLLTGMLVSFCDENGSPILIFRISSMMKIGGTRNITSTKPSIFVLIDIVWLVSMLLFFFVTVCLQNPLRMLYSICLLVLYIYFLQISFVSVLINYWLFNFDFMSWRFCVIELSDMQLIFVDDSIILVFKLFYRTPCLLAHIDTFTQIPCHLLLYVSSKEKKIKSTTCSLSPSLNDLFLYSDTHTQL